MYAIRSYYENFAVLYTSADAPEDGVAACNLSLMGDDTIPLQPLYPRFASPDLSLVQVSVINESLA